MNLATVAFLAATLFPQTPEDAAPTQLEKLVRTAGPRVAAVKVFDKSGNVLGQGSGFVIRGTAGEGLCVASNRHVLRGAHSATVTFPGMQPIGVDGVVAEDSQHDVAIVRLVRNAAKLEPLPLANSLPRVGQDIAAIGNPAGLSNSVSNGIVAALRELESYGSVIQITAPISPGSSGSPVFTMDGEVVGIATFQLRSGQNLNFAIPVRWLHLLDIGDPVPLAAWSGDLSAAPRVEPRKGKRAAEPMPEAARGPHWWLEQVLDQSQRCKSDGPRVALQAAEQWHALGDEERCRDAIAKSVTIAGSGQRSSFHRQMEFYVRLNDYLSADVLATRSISGRAHHDIGLYLSMLSASFEHQTLTAEERGEILASAKKRLDLIPKPQYRSALKSFEPAPHDRCQALADYTEMLVWLERYEEARNACAEAIQYKTEYTFLHDEPLRRFYETRTRLLLRARDLRGAEEAWTELDSYAYSASALRSKLGRLGWERRWRAKADALRTRIGRAALEQGDQDSFGRYRSWLDGRVNAAQGVGECLKAVEVLLVSGDTTAAMRLAKGDPSALLAPLHRFAATGQLQKASRLLPLLSDEQKLAGRSLLLEQAWHSGNSAVFTRILDELDAELTSFEGPGLLWNPWGEDRFPHIKRWGLVKVRTNDIEDVYRWWTTLYDPRIKAVVALAAGQQLATTLK